MTQPRTVNRRRGWICLPVLVVVLAVGHRSPAAEPTDSAAPAKATEEATIGGRVLLPDGRAAAGAGIYWVRFQAKPPRKPEDVSFEKRASTDPEGRFTLILGPHDAPLDKTPRPLVAYLPGYGFDWLEIVQDQPPHEAVLHLVADQLVRGRVTNTEGQRVAGAKITVHKISTTSNGNLDDFLAAGKKDWRGARQQLHRQSFASRLLPFLMTVTDKDGRFELSGIGAERVATVGVSAPGIVSDEIEVVNRQGFDAATYNRLAAATMLPAMQARRMSPHLAGPVFDHIAETELVVRGNVFTGPERTPVAAALVSAQGGGVNNPISAQTDEKGRFELRGLPRSQDAPLSVFGPKAGNLLWRHLALDLTPGQTTIDVEIELKEGIVVQGRVFDQATGRGVKSGVNFVPLSGNQYTDQPGYDGAANARMAASPTDDDGRFRLLVMPGPGVLMAQVQYGRPGMRMPQFGRGRPGADDEKPIPYRQARFSEADHQHVAVTADGDERYFTTTKGRIEWLTRLHAVKFIDLAPGSAAMTCDLPLEMGKTAKIVIEDEQAQPVTDAFVSGVADTGPMVKIAEPTCVIYGLGADRPRQLFVVHSERHLAGTVTLTGDEPGPVTVRLAPTASIAGRVFDPDGEPLANAVVQIFYMRRTAQRLYPMANRDQAPLTTDGEGRFHAENVLPGERLTLSFRQGNKFFGGPRITSEDHQLEAGQKLDLGEVRATLPQ